MVQYPGNVSSERLWITSSGHLDQELMIGMGGKKVHIWVPVSDRFEGRLSVEGTTPLDPRFLNFEVHAWDVNIQQGRNNQLHLLEGLRAPGAHLMVRISKRFGIVGLEPDQRILEKRRPLREGYKNVSQFFKVDFKKKLLL